MLPEIGDAHSRLATLVEHGSLDDDAVQWIIGRFGLLAACRDAVHSGSVGALTDPRLDDLLDRLDDFLPVSLGPRPSQRARAIVALARLAIDPRARQRLGLISTAVLGIGTVDGRLSEGDVDAESGSALLERLADSALPTRRPALLSALDVVRWYEAQPPSDIDDVEARSAVTIVTSRHVHGEVVRLTFVERSGPPGVGIDLLRGPFLRADAEFDEALRRAATLADAADVSVRWLATSSRSGVVLDAVEGASGGLGAALALARIVDPHRAAIDPSWVFTGRLDASGAISSLHTGRNGPDYLNKVMAVQQRTLVVPSPDESLVRRAAEESGSSVRVIGAATLRDAEALVARHLAGRASYERALLGTLPDPPSANRRLRITAIAAAAVVAALVFGWWIAGARSAHLELVRSRSSAWGSSVRKEIDGGTFDVQTNEVSNGQYAECRRSAPGRCSALQFEQTAVDKPLEPVRGVTAVQAAGFCEWLGASLPTKDQWEALVRLNGDNHYPVTTGRLQPSASDATDPGELNNLAGNLAEWTRTTCPPVGRCSDAWTSGPPPRTLLVVGLAFNADPGLSLATVADVLLQENSMAAQQATPNLDSVGFRCIRGAA